MESPYKLYLTLYFAEVPNCALFIAPVTGNRTNHTLRIIPMNLPAKTFPFVHNDQNCALPCESFDNNGENKKYKQSSLFLRRKHRQCEPYCLYSLPYFQKPCRPKAKRHNIYLSFYIFLSYA